MRRNGQATASQPPAKVQHTANTWRAPDALREAEHVLRSVMAEGEREMESLGRDFEGLARASNAILESAGAIVGCAESDRMASVLPGVQKLGSAAKGFIRTRLEATAGILDTVIAEQALLQQLSHLTRGQKATQADGILEISTSIKRIAAAWGEITTKSEAATQQIRDLVEQSRTTQEAFSEGSYAGLREARAETARGLEILREAAQCADTRGQEVETEVFALQGRIAGIGGTGDRLAACFARLDGALEVVESARAELEQAGGSGGGRSDEPALEQRFGVSYTTEMERAVLRAALAGGPLPAAQQSFAGNSVELF